ncbi:EAL domain-containing protein [Inhella sp.]|uniref:EAL domain-containing protein n=1 Tax=Inhella sp. TaxID=1921806 RepID=UPI0035B2B054
MASAHPLFPSNFTPLQGSAADCESCARGDALGFDFRFAFQPIVDLGTRSVFAREALVRGTEGQGAGWVLDQVNDGNRYRFDQACRVKAIKMAAEQGLSERISINFLPNAIYRPEVCIRTTLAAARTHGFPLERIIFEVTEGEQVEDGAWLAEILREYRRTGFLTAIDDFGAGYAGLKLLADFQPDLVKLDMHLVRGIDADKPRRAIVRGLLSTCEELGIQVIAEGIETRAERDALADLGVRLMQGYWFARPSLDAVLAPLAGSWD